MRRLIRGLLLGLSFLLIVVAPAPGVSAFPLAAVPTTGQAVESLVPYDEAMIQLLERWSLPGGGLAVVKDGRLVLARGYGLADRDAGLPVQPDSLFRVASLSKPITSAAVLQLVERGLLDLDAPAFRLLEDLQPDGATVDPRIWQITVRHLLHHTAGWDRAKSGDPVFAPRSVMAARAVGGPVPTPCETIISWAFTQPLDFDPGTQVAYSNLGYCVLGHLIERTTGQAYAQYVGDNVLKPVGASRMRIGGSIPAEHVDGEVSYYDFPGAPLINPEAPGVPRGVPYPDGGLYLPRLSAFGGWIASPIDYARFTSSLMGHRQPAILKPETMKLLSTRPAPPVAVGAPAFYGLGWNVRPQPNERNNMWHLGGMPGSTGYAVAWADNVVYVALFNSLPQPDKLEVILLDIDRSLALATNDVNTASGWPDHDLFGQYP